MTTIESNDISFLVKRSSTWSTACIANCIIHNFNLFVFTFIIPFRKQNKQFIMHLFKFIELIRLDCSLHYIHVYIINIVNSYTIICTYFNSLAFLETKTKYRLCTLVKFVKSHIWHILKITSLLCLVFFTVNMQHWSSFSLESSAVNYVAPI